MARRGELLKIDSGPVTGTLQPASCLATAGPEALVNFAHRK
jgi:hypothetical protein